MGDEASSCQPMQNAHNLNSNITLYKATKHPAATATIAPNILPQTLTVFPALAPVPCSEEVGEDVEIVVFGAVPVLLPSMPPDTLPGTPVWGTSAAAVWYSASVLFKGLYMARVSYIVKRVCGFMGGLTG